MDYDNFLVTLGFLHMLQFKFACWLVAFCCLHLLMIRLTSAPSPSILLICLEFSSSTFILCFVWELKNLHLDFISYVNDENEMYILRTI